jgi:hypothetical protein
MILERPAFSGWDIPGGHHGLDLPPGAMCWEADHGIPSMGAGAASLAGRVRIHGWTDGYSPSSGRIARQ